MAKTNKTTSGKKRPQKINWASRRPVNANTSVRDELRDRGFSAAYALWAAKRAFKKNQDEILDQYMSMFRDKIPPAKILQNLYDMASDNNKYPNKPLAYIFRTWIRREDQGQKLAQFTRHWLPPSALPLLRAGEMSGELTKTIAAYLFVAKKTKEMKKALRGAFQNPLFNLVIIIIYIYIIAAYITPSFEKALPRSAWTGSLAILGKITDLTTTDLPYLLAFIAIVIAAITWSMNHYLSRGRIALDMYPPWSIYRMMNGATFILSYSTLFAAKQTDEQIFKTLKPGTNPYYLQRLTAIEDRIKRGSRLGQALNEAGYLFPDKEIIGKIQIYQTLSNFTEALDSLTKQWIDKNIKSVIATAGLLSTLINVVCYIFIMLITTATYSFVNQVQDYLQSHH